MYLFDVDTYVAQAQVSLMNIEMACCEIDWIDSNAGQQSTVQQWSVPNQMRLFNIYVIPIL